MPKLFFCGEVNGSNLHTATSFVENILPQYGHMDALIVCGRFAPADLFEFVTRDKHLPLPVFAFSDEISDVGVENLTILRNNVRHELLGLFLISITNEYASLSTCDTVDLVLTSRNLVDVKDKSSVELSLKARYVLHSDKGSIYSKDILPDGSQLISITDVNCDGRRTFLHDINLADRESPLQSTTVKKPPVQPVHNDFHHRPAVQPIADHSRPVRKNSHSEENVTKRPRPEDDFSDRTIFVGNLPYDASPAGMESALRRLFMKSAGVIEKIKLNIPKGLAWLTFDSAAAALAACNPSQPLALNKRQLRISMQRSGNSKPDTAPHSDCWFCLANPEFDQKYILTANLQAYTVLSKGGITAEHSVLSSVAHCPSAASLEPDTAHEVQSMIDHMIAVFAKKDMDTVLFERWIPMRMQEANHLQIHLVPVRKGIDWTYAGSRIRQTQGLRVTSNEKIIDSVSLVKETVGESNQPYLWVMFPKTADRPDGLICTGRIPMHLAREVICETLGCPERSNWRDCQSKDDEELKVISILREELNQQDA